MPRIHSLALRLVRVAHGGLDAAITSGNSHDWDLAAADLLVHEAGGMLTSLDGKPLIYNQPTRSTVCWWRPDASGILRCSICARSSTTGRA